MLVAAVATAIALIAGSTKTSPLARERSEGQGPATQRHQDLLEHLGNREGPATYADQMEALNAIRATAHRPPRSPAPRRRSPDKSHGKGHGKHSTTSWYSLGPTKSVYPASLNRHGSDYPASGRITALALAPGCAKSTAPFGSARPAVACGGLTRHSGNNQKWQNVSDGYFTSGAIGSLTYDAAHHTLYAGTGEDAAAGDAEAGVGIYKSTDGGDTWTPLGGNANFVFRAVRQIAVDTNDPTGNTIYVADGRAVHGISSTTAGVVSLIPGGPGVGVWKSTDGGATFTLLAADDSRARPAGGTDVPSSFGSTARRHEVDRRSDAPWCRVRNRVSEGRLAVD